MPRKSTKKTVAPAPAILPPTVTYNVPLANLVAIGKLLYVRGDATEDGLTPEEDKLLSESFDVIDEFLTKHEAVNWLSDLEEPENETED